MAHLQLLRVASPRCHQRWSTRLFDLVAHHSVPVPIGYSREARWEETTVIDPRTNQEEPRRNCKPINDRVIGCLLGTRTGNSVEVTNCFPVGHEDKEDTVDIRLDYFESLRALHAQANPNEEIVGWCVLFLSVPLAMPN